MVYLSESRRIGMKIDDIKTKEDLSEFIKVLMNEYNKDDWENNNIPDF